MIKDIIWMTWVLLFGILESIIHILNKDIYLIIEEDEWAITPIKRKYD